jgi:hypothetical protein
MGEEEIPVMNAEVGMDLKILERIFEEIEQIAELHRVIHRKLEVAPPKIGVCPLCQKYPQ